MKAQSAVARAGVSGKTSPSAGSRGNSRRGASALLRVQRAFGLSKTELGRLFGGISRQAVTEWHTKGVPPGRIADVERVGDLAQILERRFVADRLPQIVRESLPGLGNHSILETIREHGTVRVFDMLERAFAYISG